MTELAHTLMWRSGAGAGASQAAGAGASYAAGAGAAQRRRRGRLKHRRRRRLRLRGRRRLARDLLDDTAATVTASSSDESPNVVENLMAAKSPKGRSSASPAKPPSNLASRSNGSASRMPGWRSSPIRRFA